MTNITHMRRPAMDQIGYHNERVFRRYEAWDQENPHFYPVFVSFTQQLIRAGHKRISASWIFDGIRWATLIKTSSDDFKLNDNFTAIYARRFMFDFPNHEALFEVRGSPRSETDLAVAA